jgi:hypothetical protein
LSQNKKVFIATPNYSGNVCASYLIAMAETFRLSNKYDVDLNLELWMHESLVQKARNNLFTKAYLNGYDEIVFIDDDQGFTAEAFYSLLSHDVDVVGYPVRMKTEEERYNIRPENYDSHTFDASLNLLEVENIGTGFLRINRKAMEVLWENSETYNSDGKEQRMICNLQVINGGLISEDIQICTKLRDNDIKIYADMNYTCSHYGTKCFEGSFLKSYVLNKLEKK